MSTQTGTIYFVGGGPGDTGLITVKGQALLREADAIVTNTHSQAALLREARDDVTLHDVGGRRRGNKMAHQDIVALLIDLAQQGKTVVRLWAGDPFVFGRTAQEMAAAREAGLRTVLVPGVTSAIAALSYAGVPVTHWDHAVSFAAVSGYVHPDGPVQPDWTALAGVDTLVILMPTERLPQIVDELLAAGRSPETPAIAVESGTLPYQKRVIATLGTIAKAAEDIQPPAIVALGDVIGLASDLDWFQPEAYPLLGRRVLVTRPTHQATEFMADLRALGADPVSFPTIEIQPIEENQALDQAILRLAQDNDYDWLVLTSANGVDAFWQRLDVLGLDARALASVKVAAIGPATASAMHRRSLRPDLLPEVYTAEGILESFDALGVVAGQRFLLARADIARKTLAEGLAKRGAHVDELPAYRTVPIERGSLPPFADIVTFTSSSTVQGYINCLDGRAPAKFLQNSRVVCIGPITAGTATRLGVPVAAVADEYTIPGILETLQSLPIG